MVDRAPLAGGLVALVGQAGGGPIAPRQRPDRVARPSRHPRGGTRLRSHRSRDPEAPGSLAGRGSAAGARHRHARTGCARTRARGAGRRLGPPHRPDQDGHDRSEGDCGHHSDEILHVAKISPFATAAKLSEEQLAALHDAVVSVLTDAVSRSVGQGAATLKGEKRSGLRVHARTGLPCPVCGDTVREVSFADKSFQYCATCQTGGKVLPHRRMSRLLK